MPFRLVLGCGSVGRRLAVADDESVRVITTNEHRIETLRSDGVTATRGDPTDPDVLLAVPDRPDTVVVASDDPDRNLKVARLAREQFPEARLFAYAGQGATEADVAALREVADDVHDPRAAVSEFLMQRVGDDGLRTRRLKRVLRNVAGPLAVVAHDNPDPDAIASAVALEHIAEQAGTPAEACYFGDISHQENRALVNLLEFELTDLASEAGDLSRFGSVALVDHSRPGVNDQLPPDTDIDIVIDHHPPRAPVEARFVDLRSDVGATSTLLTDYLRRLGINPSSALATALLFGIHVDTREFSREVATEDFEAAAYLVGYADTALLERIESPSASVETFEIIGRAIVERDIRADVLTTYVGEVSDRDALAQAADHLLGLEGITTTLVFGFIGDTIYVSARARAAEVDLGEALREAFGQIGSAGGHADMAGAQIPVGGLVGEEDNRDEVIRDVLTDRFFETVGVDENTAAAAVYATDDYLGTDLDDRRRDEPGDPA